ncbi:MAG: ribbon-helix-helix protein, CopG family [Vampirovibrionales bacterium]|nr:ribbon-helix-helix protein, CopG family [Vampirovibrionales bacterium]
MARVLISMKDDFLEQVDTMAEQEQRSRSELIREALRTYMRRSGTTRSSRYLSDAEAIEDILSL